jgi:HEAT repeat protein
MARLTQLEEKEKIDFIKLGKEVFSKKSEKPEYIFEAGNIKEILTEIKEIEVDKRKIQEKLEDQKRKEEEAKIIKRAVKNLNSPNYRTRLVALQVLGRVSAKETIPEVQKMLEDPSQEVRTQAAEVLKLLTRNIVSSQQSDISSSQPMAEQENRDKGK